MTFLSKKNSDIDDDCYIISTNRTGIAIPDLLDSILNEKDGETIYTKKRQEEIYEGQNDYIRIPYVSGGHYTATQDLLLDIKQQGVPLITLCKISQGIVTGLDKISVRHIKKIPSLVDQRGKGVYVLNSKEKEGIGESPLIKPWFKNSDIYRYKVNHKNYQWVIHVNADTKLDKYPNVKNHPD